MSSQPAKLVSVHGGHSGQFCHHAKDNLEALVLKYIELSYSWAGITEHAPPISDNNLYPDEKESGLTSEYLFHRFSQYIDEARRLQKKYKPLIKLFVGFEIETYSGYLDFVPQLIQRFQPDYIVGSVHFVNDICFDYSEEFYEKAIQKAGSIEQLYHDYFDAQWEMIKALRPAIVGHFDLIRLFDAAYEQRLQLQTVRSKILRNLRLIKEKDLILDYNLRALLKGAEEPYVSMPILKLAKELDINVVPGDDSHSCDSIGCHMDEGIRILQTVGFSTDWKDPATLSY